MLQFVSLTWLGWISAIGAVAAGVTTGRDDSDDLERLKRDDPAAWRALVERYGPALVAYATRMLRDRQTAEEVVQEAVVSVHAGFAQFEGRCSVKSWLYRAVHNKAVDELRRRKRFVDVPDDEEARWDDRFGSRHWKTPPSEWAGSVGARIDAARVLDVVGRRLETLPHQHREVLLMKEVHGLQTAEICDALAISPENLRVCLYRARRALRDAVAAELEEGRDAEL